jgi:hypothetical protein
LGAGLAVLWAGLVSGGLPPGVKDRRIDEMSLRSMEKLSVGIRLVRQHCNPSSQTVLPEATAGLKSLS